MPVALVCNFVRSLGRVFVDRVLHGFFPSSAAVHQQQISIELFDPQVAKLLVPRAKQQARIAPATQFGRGAKSSGAPEQILADVADVVFGIRVLRRFDPMVVGPERRGPRGLEKFRRRPHYGPSTADDVVLEEPRPGHAQSHHSSLQPSLQAVFLLRFHVEPTQNARAKIDLNVMERRDSLATRRGPPFLRFRAILRCVASGLIRIVVRVETNYVDAGRSEHGYPSIAIPTG